MLRVASRIHIRSTSFVSYWEAIVADGFYQARRTFVLSVFSFGIRAGIAGL